MPSKLLVKHPSTGEESEFELLNAETRIGRGGRQNDLILDDKRVSREHALLRQSGSSYVIVDLKSGNGTRVNGRRISECTLVPGDVITIGEYILTYYEINEATSIQFDTQPLGETILFRTAGQVFPQLPLMNTTTGTSAESIDSPPVDNLKTLQKKAETLTRFYELSRLLSSVFSLDDIFRNVAKMLFRLTPTNRFMVLLRDVKSGELLPFLTEFDKQHQSPLGATITISKTVLDRVSSDCVSLLCCDTQADERLARASSLLMEQVHSVMCAPLMGKKGLLGVIYVDCQEQMKMFSADDLDLLNALAVETSMAVDNAMTHDQLLKEALARTTYGRFMPRHVVDEILASPDALSLGGTNQLVTMLFSDIRGFTALSETLPPETVVHILNNFFAAMTPIIFGRSGLLDKYMGDGLMAVFGVPYPSPEAAANAVSAAIAMQYRVLALNQDLKEKGLPEIAIGIGINTGTAIVGYLGSEERTDYTAIGDAVNLAARFEKQAQAQQILIGCSTFEAIGNRFPARAFGEIQVKGKRKPVPVYEILWKQAE